MKLDKNVKKIVGFAFCLFAGLAAFSQEKTSQDQEEQLEKHEKEIAELKAQLNKEL